MVRAMCGVQLNDRGISTDLMAGLNETIDQLAMAGSVCSYGHVLRREDGHVLRREDGHVLRREDGHVLRREDGHVLRRALQFEVKGQWKKGRSKRTWKMQVDEESVKVGLRREDSLCRSKWSVGVDEIAAELR